MHLALGELLIYQLSAVISNLSYLTTSNEVTKHPACRL
jgi:hypothetical protein